MKATDLMLGDWIKDYTYGAVKVSSIEGRSIGIKVGEKEYSAIHPEQAKPIPLTVEILEKNGFVYEYDYGSYYRSRWGDIASKQYITIGWNSRGEVYQYDVHNDKKTVYGNCSICLHELQHALRLCGLNDLANNFRID